MKTIITTTLGAVLAIATAAAFGANPLAGSQQTPPAAPPAMHPAMPAPAGACSSHFPAFSQLDTQGQGYVTKKEANSVPKLSKSFKKADTNHNGKLSQTEYAQWVQQQCGPGRS